MTIFPYGFGDDPDDGFRDDPHRHDTGLDDTLVELVADRLTAEVYVFGREMHVSVQNGVVILEGGVATPEMRAAAGRQAWATPGVRDVCNMLVSDL
ncbi:BON domain-containing protein [Actinoplanes sp. N902-109]|uniref:BON domain-containing protein n=1 Tax=Actinoplanes sp. (strain N902-109) TaxID=649831 RepID=UPI000329642A|nr:BON domain-containing protein [Actinoplanes sp. N902-109]AGL16280.1 transport-associated protein [Actinoplanes sp. N902-109]